jgi:hypothetical protein
MQLDIKNKCTLICAKRGSGKSVLAKWLIQSCEFERIICFCPTEEINAHYSRDGLVDKRFIFSDWDEEYCKDLCDKMTKLNSNKTKAEMKHVLLILDDCFADTSLHHSAQFKSMMMRSRHYGLAIMCLCQTLHSCPPFGRINMDNVILGMCPRASILLASDEYLSGDLDVKSFVQLYHKATQDYGFLLINNNSIKNSMDIDAIYGVLKTPKEFVT